MWYQFPRLIRIRDCFSQGAPVKWKQDNRHWNEAFG